MRNNVVLSADKLRKYFPRSYTPQKMEETILKLLDAWLRKRQRDQSRYPPPPHPPRSRGERSVCGAAFSL